MKNNNNMYICILLSLYARLRIGEICGFKWDDINFKKSLFTVRQTVQRIRTGVQGTKLIVNTPKSPCFQQAIPIHAFFMGKLQEFITLQRS